MKLENLEMARTIAEDVKWCEDVLADPEFDSFRWYINSDASDDPKWSSDLSTDLAREVIAALKKEYERRLSGLGVLVNGVVENPHARMSNRLTEVWEGLSRGLTNKEIAREINVTEATVKVHIKSLFAKIGVKNRTAAALMWQKRQGREAA